MTHKRATPEDPASSDDDTSKRVSLDPCASAPNISDDESSETKWGDSEHDEVMHDELDDVAALAAGAEAASVDANLRETREADKRVLRLRNENAYEMALKTLEYDDVEATRQREMFTTPDRTLALLLTGATLAELTAFQTSQPFRKEITKLTGADDTASLICNGASTATSSLKGMQIRFASQAMATEARAALLELQPTRIWPAFVVRYVREEHYRSGRFSLSGKTVPAAVPSARSQNAKVSAK